MPKANNINGQIRMSVLLKFPPITACQIFVIREGTSIIDIALGKSIATVSNARLIVGKPRPKTPFTVPAIVKTPTAITIV